MSDTAYIKDEPWGHYAKWYKPITKDKLCVIPLKWCMVDKLIEIQRYRGYQGLSGGGKREFLFYGYRAFVWKSEKVLEIDDDENGTTL